MHYIDLRSDTVTQPTLAMRAAMAAAEVGDDVYGDDPTMNELEALAAQMLGKEAAMFATSGTMGNQIGIMSQTRRGDEIIAGAESHIVMHEVGAAAVLSGVSIRQIDYPNCIPVPEMIAARIRPNDIHEPPTAAWYRLKQWRKYERLRTRIPCPFILTGRAFSTPQRRWALT